jgi:hypothetical protein
VSRADDNDEDREWQGAKVESLLHDETADRRCDHQNVVGQDVTLILRLPELLAVLAPVRQYRIRVPSSARLHVSQPGPGLAA